MTAMQTPIVLIKASLVLALCFAGLTKVSAQDNTADLIYQLQQLQEEIRQLRGLVEQQAFELENIKRLQSDQYADLDERIRTVDESIAARPSVTPLPPAALPGDGNLDSQTPAIALDIPEVREPIVDNRQVATLDQPVVTGPSVAIAASPLEEKAAYEDAFSALKDLRYADSARQFRRFIEVYPDGEYADNAQYWLGESYYAAGNYPLALQAFTGLLENYPDSSKYADALLKIGYTHYEQQQWPQARAALEQVTAQYPQTALSRLAESRLRSMRLEGRF